MTDSQLEELGPIDYIVIEWPGRQPTGEAAPLILDLHDRGIIRILDVAFMVKDEDGNAAGVSIEDLGVAEFNEFDGASSGLLGDEDLERALAKMRANLADGGLLLFDVNSKGTYAEGSWAGGSRTVERNGRSWTWHGIGELEDAPSVFETRIEGDGIDQIIHKERFRPEAEVLAAMTSAGLDCLAALGMQEIDDKVVLSDPPDEDRDYKVIYIGAKAK